MCICFVSFTILTTLRTLHFKFIIDEKTHVYKLDGSRGEIMKRFSQEAVFLVTGCEPHLRKREWLAPVLGLTCLHR